MADRVGFEPTEPFSSPDFKSGAIDQLCHLSVKAEREGFEPSEVFRPRSFSKALP